MAKLKPCPFCGCELEKKHIHYKAIKNKVVDYDCWDHPLNDCIMAEIAFDNRSIRENDIEAWNRRAEDKALFDAVSNIDWGAECE
jgi:hypothetical protein